MNTINALVCLTLITFVCISCTGNRATAPTDICTQQWYEFIEDRISTGDGHGHGPDIGSDEWKSVIEFKLGLRGNAAVPDRSSVQWCAYINTQLSGSD